MHQVEAMHPMSYKVRVNLVMSATLLPYCVSPSSSDRSHIRRRNELCHVVYYANINASLLPYA
uniref:Uncharacterized protein n=1 Tax=Parascaris equorum TaxID=6256 RepID=A0A914R3H1_PAREQ